MTTTEQFQKLPDYYNSLEECKKFTRIVVSNPRYGTKGFYQTHFTAGDEDQFQEYRDATNSQVCIPRIKLSENKFADVDFSERLSWAKYQNLNATAVNNTFRYMFNKFKKGIFVQIKNNQLNVFLPFSKASFVNEWGDRIKIDPMYGNMYNFVKHTNNMIDKRYRVRVNKFPSNWYANNCLVRYEFPINEGDTNTPIMSDMLKTLCASRKVPDIEFFINRRDFPVIRKNGTEAYEHIFGDNHQLVSHEYEQYAPILSMVTSNEFADIPIPTGDDWGRISSYESKYYDRGCKAYPSPDEFNIKWGNKKPTAIFRGASTGCGVTIDTNVRLKLAYISANTPPDKDGPLLDAGISKWQLRPRKLKGERYLQTIDVPDMNRKGIHLASFVTPYEQSGYKYIIHADGHVSAFRLSLEMSMGSVILLVDSPYMIWFRSMLKPMVHYVPVKADLSDLIEKIKWCRDNDRKCKKIAKRAKKFYLQYLQKDGVLDYMQKLIVNLKNETGQYLYNDESPLYRQIRLEKILDTSYPPTSKTIANIGSVPRQARSYGVLKGLEWVINMVNTESSFHTVAASGKVIFANKAKTVIVQEYTLAGFSFVIKATTDPAKEMENIHETYIGINVINNVVKYIPNFAYVFGSYDGPTNSTVIMEKIHGVTLTKWIESEKFNMEDFIFILLQLAFALEVAQRQCGFVHYDLTPWNIMIQEIPTPVQFDYVIDSNNIYRINTKLIPVIIDYGKSHVIHKNQHHGFINMYKTSTVQDIISLLITSIGSIIEYDLSGKDVDDAITLANFMTNTGYRQRPFRKSGAKGVSDMQYFFSKAKKYTELISSDKHELEKLTPMDFIQYINMNFKYAFPYEKIDYPVFRINKGNPRQVFEYILSSSDSERRDSFTSVFQRVLDCEFPESVNMFFDYYAAQTLEDNLSSVYLLMKRYLEKNKVNVEQYEKIYKRAMKKVKRHYKTRLSQVDEEKVSYDLDNLFKNLESAPYDENTFLVPDVILNLLGKYKKESKMADLSEYQNVILKVLLNNGMFKLSDAHMAYYLKNFDDLLKVNALNMQNNVANAITLYQTARGIYSRDRESLATKLPKKRSKKRNCTSANEYMSIYDRILAFLDKTEEVKLDVEIEESQSSSESSSEEEEELDSSSEEEEKKRKKN